MSLDRVLDQCKDLAALDPVGLNKAIDVVGAAFAAQDELAAALYEAVNDPELGAKIKEAATPPYVKTETSDACSRCPAACCRRFWMPPDYTVLPQRGHRSTPWHTRVRILWGQRGLPPPPEEIAFMNKYFKVAPSDNTNMRRRRTTKRGLAYGETARHEPKVPKIRGLALTCKALVNNRCSKYDERPEACRRFLCPEARAGKTPVEAGAAKSYPGCTCTKTLKRLNR